MFEGFEERGGSVELERAGALGPKIKASVPLDITKKEFVEVAGDFYDLINKLTGCNCMSGIWELAFAEQYRNVLSTRFAKVGRS